MTLRCLWRFGRRRRAGVELGEVCLTANAMISPMNTETIRQEALSLPVQQRAELAEQLLSSLDALSESEIEQLWLREAARRADEIDRGLAKRIPADEAHRQAQALLR